MTIIKGLSRARLRAVKTSKGNRFYNVHAAILDASNFGLPQSRKRVFLIALKRTAQKTLVYYQLFIIKSHAC